ncbi:MAG TPA: BON domain-containing protein [Pirellulales bacterium]|jgi:hypothetical protein|nr:BON domain-containing protein [Pirellulales bacterium]
MRRTIFTCLILAAASLPGAVRAGEREDRATAEQIAMALRDSRQMQSYSVGVKYKNGTVWLNGRVNSEQQLQAALQVVSDLEGIEKIVNGLEVKPAATKAPPARSANRKASFTNPEPMSPAGASPQAQAPQAQADGEVQPTGFHTGYHALKSAARQGGPPPMYAGGSPGAPPAYDQPHMPNYAWPSYAAYPNYAALTYPKQYSPTAWPFIGPFYPYPQVPLGWRKVALEWDDGWWFLDFYDRNHH